MSDVAVYPVKMAEQDESYTVNVDCDCELDIKIGTAIQLIDNDTYDGEYEFVPTDQVQIIQISGLTATMDITIDPIPNNYGLITWDGSSLTVS